MRRFALLLAAASVAVLALAAPAHGAEAFGLSRFDVVFEGPAGESQAQAGSHPFQMTTSFAVNVEEIGGQEAAVEAVKDLEIFQVPGFAGDQTAVPPCSTLDFLTLPPGVNDHPECPNSSAVGVVKVKVGQGESIGDITVPLYFLEPAPGSVARLGFIAGQVPVTIDIGLSEEPPYTLVAHTTNVSQVLEFFEGEVTLWGVPADPVHDAERGSCRSAFSPPGAQCPAGLPPKPFLTLPRACEGPLLSEWEMDSWQHPGAWVFGAAETHDDAEPPNPAGMVGCSKIGFSPTTGVRPTTTSAESSSGIDAEIEVKDEGLKNPEGIAGADIEEIVTYLPAGMTANPSAAEGLGVCSEEQFEESSLGEQLCPAGSTLGTVEVETPLLKNHPLRGIVYLGAQKETAAGSLLLPLYLMIEDEELGIFIEQEGEASTNLQTGQLVTVFSELPPFPLSNVALRLRSGPRAPLITPPMCGTYATEMELAPSSGAEPLLSESSFEVSSGPGGGPCPTGGVPPFSPGFEASSVNNAAGQFSPFSLRMTRGDGEQDITRFSAVLPPGVVGKIAGVAKCPDAAIEAAKRVSGREELASPSCPPSSKLGRVVAGAGVGVALTFVEGSLYLAGPFGGDPLSVVAIVPAVAGPFDVGTVVTREALTLNPSTTEVEVDGAHSDPIPHLLKGIPLSVRDLRVYTDRREFTLNPTSCAEQHTRAQITGGGANPFSSADDFPVARTSRYQAASCASLAFKPRLSLTLRGGTRRSDHPSLQAVLTPRAGDANVASVSTTLPHSEFIDPERISNPCTRVQFNENACPPTSVLGTAKAYTPLLDEPLEGPVYFRSNGGERKVPDLVADVHGEGLHIIQVGFVDSVKARIRTRFLSLPDAPVNKIVLALKGGKEGVIVNSANLCAHTRHVKVAMGAQNGRRVDSEPVLKVSCKAKAKKQHINRH